MLSLSIFHPHLCGPATFAGTCLRRKLTSLQVHIEVLQQATSIPVNDLSRVARYKQDNGAMAQTKPSTLKDKPVRLWLLPCVTSALTEHQGSQKRAECPLVRADSPPLADVDVALKIDTDLRFPIDSYLGSGASGEVRSSFTSQHTTLLALMCTSN